ncbi:MAG: thioredoxin-disulfide reductase [Candidatus Hydrogenedentota bacterium]|nr:MAG: thioredoxin-disulfide reductase [Candidatus Hydrogenedentota bacterium]
MTQETHYDTIIIGSGPAGYTAAIYAGRANLKTLLLEGVPQGGQLMITNEVENYPGFPEGVLGPELMAKFKAQAERFGAKLLPQMAEEAVLNQGKPFKILSEGTWYTADSVIIATGASARFLGIPSEEKFKGKGVSACATCDGFFFKDKHVIVVGGGDSAMEEATFLTKFASKVTIVHRRDVFRASKIMLERAKNNPKIEILTFKVIDEIYGDEETGVVKGVKLKDTRTGEITDFPVEGIFIAIGHDPNTKLFEGQLDLNEKKYIVTKPDKTATSIEGVFAAGDVQDSYYRQAITAAGSGCMAAIEAERYLESIRG